MPDCISIALIEWEKDGSVYKSERPANHTAGTFCAGGNGGGSGLHQLNKPSDIEIAGNYFYVADRENHRVMRWPFTAVGGDPGVVVAGGNGWGSGDHQLKQPEALSVDPSGAVYISDCGNTDSTCQMVTVTAPAVPLVGTGSGANDQAGSNGPDGDLSSSAEGAIAQISWDFYPNPTDGWLQISASMKDATVELMDMQGRVMETHRMEDYSMTLDLSDRARGTYMIRLIHAGGVHMERIILD